MPTLTKKEILERLAAHQPLGEFAANRGLAVRWIATAALVLLLPLGVIMLRDEHPFLASHVWAVAFSLTAVGLLGVYIAYRAASRREAVDRQWGFSPLTKEECLELGEISLDIPEISVIIDHWLEVWMSSGHNPRGRDLALVREMIQAWNVASKNSEAKVSSPSAPGRRKTVSG